MQNIIKQLQSELEKLSEKGLEDHESSPFSLEPYSSYGVRNPIVRKLSAKKWREIKQFEKQEIFNLCEELLATKISEMTLIAFDWAYRVKKNYEAKDFKLFESWVKKYVNTWFYCDDLCGHTLGHFLIQFHEYVAELKKWARSKNRWFQRAACVSLLVGLRRGKFLNDAFEIADILLEDEDDLVQKGYGWMLKEASKKFPDEVFEFVMKRKDKMPRTALRYSIEKMPESRRKRAMS